MSIKYVFSDIDFTLLGPDQVLSEKNIKAINSLKERDIKFIPLSGRMPCAMQNVLNILGINHRKDEYMIASNGALICDTELNLITDNYVKDENLLKCIDYFYSIPSAAFSLSAIDHYYLCRDLIGLDERETDVYIHSTYEEIRNMVGTKKFYKFLAQNEDPVILKEMVQKVGEITNGEMVAIESTSYNLEVHNAHISKGNALKYFCEKMNYRLDECLIIGDNYNDISMAEIAGYSACPANAVEDLKRMCTYVSSFDCS
ncbi:MAG: HAD-IIB family hydrolase, partial [Erysipelotrichaceae bacterium]|nr:HAD-IIB family hydrolase [Erysipelotrichaceae bacterium]